MGKTSIHPFYNARRGLESIPAAFRREASTHETPWTSRQLIAGSTQAFTLTFTPKDNLELAVHPSTQMLVFGLWEEYYTIIPTLWANNCYQDHMITSKSC